MTNIVKHAEATTGLVNIIQHDNCINIFIEDNGIGMDTEVKANQPGIGLALIRNKVSLLQGNISITSKKGSGTAISVEIPLKG